MKVAWPSRGPAPRGTQRSRPPVLLAAELLATAALAVSGHAAAQEPSKADLNKARTLFRDGVALASAGDCVGALAKYKAVAQIKMSPQVAFNTAECEARLGKLVSALGNYRMAASQAADDKKAGAVLKEAPARIDDLEARIPKLTITRSKSAETATVELDGSEVGSAQIGVATPVDPGTHTIVAKVGNKEYLHETVKLAEKGTKTFDVNVVLPTARVETVPDEPTPDKPAEAQGKSKVPGIVVTTVGGVAMIAGFAFLAPRASAVSKLSMDCNSAGHCPMDDSSTASQGKLFTGLTEVFVPVGVVTMVVGIVLIAKAGPPSKDKPADEKKDDKGDDKKDAWWRSIQVVASAPGASVGGASLTGRF